MNANCVQDTNVLKLTAGAERVHGRGAAIGSVTPHVVMATLDGTLIIYGLGPLPTSPIEGVVSSGPGLAYWMFADM